MSTVLATLAASTLFIIGFSFIIAIIGVIISGGTFRGNFEECLALTSIIFLLTGGVGGVMFASFTLFKIIT